MYEELEGQIMNTMAEREKTLKELRKITPASVVGGLAAGKSIKSKEDYDAMFETLPAVKKIDAKLAELQQGWTGLSQRMTNPQMRKALAISGVNVEDFTGRQYSPLEKMKMTPEQLARAEQEEAEINRKLFLAQQKVQEREMDLMAKRIGDQQAYAAGQVAARQHPFNMELQAARTSGSMQAAAQEAQQKQIAQYVGNTATLIASDSVQQVNNVIDQFNRVLKTNDHIPIPDTANITTGLKAYYENLGPAGVEASQNDMQALGAFYNVLGTRINQNNKVKMFRNVLPGIANYMSGGSVPEATKEELKKMGIMPLSSSQGTNPTNPFSQLLTPFTYFHKTGTIKDEDLKKMEIPWVLSTSRNTPISSAASGGQ